MSSAVAMVRMLLVEDNPADSEMVRRALADYGPIMELTQASSLVQAAGALKSQFYHLVVTDLNLPDVEGLQTFLRLKEISPDSAFVVMTGIQDREAGIQAIRAGAQDYLVKGDFGPQRVWLSLRNALLRQGILRDATTSAKKLTEANARLKTLTRVDPLTGLYNRRGFDERLGQESSPDSSPDSAVLLIDVDDFKLVNDRLGHDQGDLALQEISRRLQLRLRPGDFAARVGGDEFMVLLSATRMADASEIAERIRRAVDGEPIQSPNGAFHVTVSVGVAHPTKQDLSAHQLLARTHTALSMSKQQGKNRVSFDRAGWAHGPLEAADAKVLKRPFFRIVDGKVVGYEFLCRSWAGPEPKLPSAGREETLRLPRALRGLMHCVEAAAQLPLGLEYHVRLYRTDLAGFEPADLLKLIPVGLDPSLLRLEIRDLARAPVVAPILGTLKALRGAGVRSVIHDSDLRQQPLATLLQLEPDWVKLGPAWLNEAGADPAKERELQRLLKAAEGLGARVMIGGVEAGEDLELMQRMNIYHGQGPLWSLHP
jgi:diguanylate cyclase (GGDEF)-like protein